MSDKKKKSLGQRIKKALSGLKMSHFILLILLLLVVAGASTIGTVFLAATSGMPSLENNDITEYDVTSYIVDKDGSFVEKLADNSNFVDVDSNEISENMLNAVTSIEDRRFYKHHGVDPIRIAGAMVANLKAGQTVQGGSTITQQLAGLALLDRNEKTYKRKIQEAVLAIRIENKYSKDEILTAYLNRCYFGIGLSGKACYGIEAAANDILGKKASELTVTDSALLAGLIQNPTYWSPITDPDNAKVRRDTVLQAMADSGAISQDEADQYKQEPITTASIVQEDQNEKQSYNQSYIDYVVDEALEVLGLEQDPSKFYTGGYIVHTALDQDLQEYMYDYFNSDYYFPSGASYDYLQGAMVVLNTNDATIAGMIGGRHQEEGQERGLNRAYQTTRQPGSTFKPIFDYGPAFEAGKGTGTVYKDAVYTTADGHTIKNADLEYHGNVTIRYALEQSLNTVAARCIEEIGPEKGLEFAKKCGITSLVENSDDGVTDATISAGLGGLTKGVSVLEMAGAYNCFASEGIYTEPRAITKITNEDGDIIWQEEPESHRAMEATTAYMVTSCLQSVVTDGIGRYGAISDGRPTAGKTGTTDNTKDLWFCGFTPQYVGAVWLGYDTPATIYSTSDAAARVFSSIMSHLHAGLDVENFQEPDGLTAVTVDTKSGNLATRSTPSAYRSTEYYKSGTEPTTYSTNSYSSYQYSSGSSGSSASGTTGGTGYGTGTGTGGTTGYGTGTGGTTGTGTGTGGTTGYGTGTGTGGTTGYGTGGTTGYGTGTGTTSGNTGYVGQ
ncbi:MAG: PBP1A family penicillin-binding protein [Peptococcaceae bacterium]|nr:PBP1A family penicillin-binding protein [Peptococcaceae bacterium]